ncbi:MAG: GH32 C-terminal domain-containing protein [Anaerolineales bacterium]|nr:GH32 C-terminal domain-containing protein [Anaerolineales bacterium]
MERILDTRTTQAGSAPYFGECVEIKACYNLAEAGTVGFDLIDDGDGFRISYDFAAHSLQAGDQRAALQFQPDPGLLDLHIFIDKSIIEIFINGWETFTAIFYPRLDGCNTLKIAPFFTQTGDELRQRQRRMTPRGGATGRPGRP